MSDQLWAVVAKSGTFTLHYTSGSDVSPFDDGHRSECRGKAVWPLEREPVEGERIDFDTGEIVFDLDHAQPGLNTTLERIISEIKEEAGRRILEAYPVWKQLNDVDTPQDPAVRQRKARRDEIRSWSNDLEDRASRAKTAEELAAIRNELTA